MVPYLTTFVANNPFSLLAQVLYGVDFLLMNIMHYFMARSLMKINPERGLSEALEIRNALVIPTIILFVIGLIIAFLGYPIAISICCLITLVRLIIYSLK